ncbi:MAG TPA: hypothetical protein VI197_35220 [Polyangiaceae bacterium]
MTRTSHIAPAALAFLAALFVTGAALAQCPSGTYQCGADYCTPDGAVCCANVGLPQYYCPSGTSCQSDGSCESGASSSVSSSSSSSSTSGGGGGCPSGSYSCGADYCTPDGAVCCANVGLPQYYCPGGTSCQSDGSCESGPSSSVSSSSSSSSTSGGGGCPSGSYPCGADYCTPDDAVCCANVGLPQYYCPGGSVCQSDGSCGAGSSSSNLSSSSSSGTTGGSDDCPSDSYACGADYCTPLGEVCCASVGLPQYYCPGGTTCQSDGSCEPVSTNTGTSGDTTANSSSASSTSGAGGTNGSGSSTSGSAPPQVEGCASYYDHGYDEYQVQVQCQSAFIYACAGHQEGVSASCDILDDWGYGSRDACPYCTGTDPREDRGGSSKESSSGGGCALSPAGSPVGEGFVLLTLLGFAGALRRRRAKPA